MLARRRAATCIDSIQPVPTWSLDSSRVSVTSKRRLLGRALAGPVGWFVLGGLILAHGHARDSLFVCVFTRRDILHVGRCGHWRHRNKPSGGQPYHKFPDHVITPCAWNRLMSLETRQTALSCRARMSTGRVGRPPRSDGKAGIDSIQPVPDLDSRQVEGSA